MFLMGIFWYHLYDMSNYKLCNLDTYNHNFGSSVGTAVITVPGALDCHYSNNIQQPTLRTVHLNMHIQQSMSVCCLSSLNSMKLSRFQVQDNIKRFYP